MSHASFRAGVVIVVRHPDRERILVFERVDSPGSWQLPQGGVHRDETPIEAAWRELGEETGLGEVDVVACAEYPEWIAYEWPDEVKAVHGRDGKRLGQVQRWFLFDALSAEIEPRPDGREFCAWRWADPAGMIGHVPEWRRHGYARVLSTL
ncbi:MAG: NUDIX domain-containing protein [Ilumatobacteraceae bacterium]